MTSTEAARFTLRRLGPPDADAAADVLRISYDERFPWLAGRQFVREHLLSTCELTGAFDPELVGVMACRPGWVEQLYVLPDRQGRGIGKALMATAMQTSTELQLWTFQRNLAARAFYERLGFVAIEETDGAANEEREPDVLYRWIAKGPSA